MKQKKIKEEIELMEMHRKDELADINNYYDKEIKKLKEKGK